MAITQAKITDLAKRLDNEFDSPFPLFEEVAEKYLDLTKENAIRKLSKGEIPFRVIQITDSQKSPKCVSTDDLAEYLLNRKQDFMHLQRAS